MSPGGTQILRWDMMDSKYRIFVIQCSFILVSRGVRK